MIYEEDVMTPLAPGDQLLPDQFQPSDFRIRATGLDVLIEIEGDGGRSVSLEATSVLSFRFTHEESFEDYREDSLDILLVVEDPPWNLRMRDEDSIRGDFVRAKSFYHLNIPDVGIFECWAEKISRG